MLTIRFDGNRGAGDEGAVNFFEQQGATRGGAGLDAASLAAQHELAVRAGGCPCDSRRQQQVPDIRFAAEQRHSSPGLLAHPWPLVAWRGTPTDTSVNQTAQNNPVSRQVVA